ELSAQTWLPGYEFRKKITFDKTKIEGDFIGSSPRVELDVTDFPVLVELQDEAFKYRTPTACEGIVYDPEGRNIAFVTVANPLIKLNFQIESYDPVLGKYRCWVKIPSLASVRTATPATAIYFYYGGTALHDSYSASGLNTWNSEYSGIWHMNGEKPDLGSRNVKTGLTPESLTGHGLVAEDKISGKIGDALELDGNGQYLHSSGHGNGAFTFMAWIKWNGGSGSQTIAGTDSIGTGRTGWRVGINAQGKIEMSTYRNAGVFWSMASANGLVPGVWTHVICYYYLNGANNSGLTILLNGNAAGGSGGAGLKFVAGGYMTVGRNKDGSQYFNGAIDEMRIYNVAKPVYWLKNEYQNQQDPSSFYSTGAEESNSSWVIFTGAVSSNWATSTNWLNSVKPVTGSKVRILAGKTGRITGGDVILGALVLEPGATLSSGVNVQLNCNAKLAAGAALNMDSGKLLSLGGNGLSLSGAGSINTGELEVNAPGPSSEVVLDAEVKISKYLKLTKGLLKTNGKLTLLSSSQSSTAAVLPILDGNAAFVTGDVHVQSFIEGNFPEPSSGRGWRLLSSPVMKEGSNAYDLKAFKAGIFVTGLGGAANGFDDSPKNGATIYTHDQSMPGTLNQKYIPVADMQAIVPIGRGVYVYSRGSRFAPNAFRDQVQVQPFSNPAPYTLTYTGKLFVGDLTVPVFNKNAGEEGDGFNLLGNPYASPIKWGALDKLNVGPFVWLFDALNGAYVVSDDPETVIPAGAGFFVKVMSGVASGNVRFTEGAKVVK
ncbi:MAG: hypothetical protein EOO88_21540, partial [Pedobacter sp.]